MEEYKTKGGACVGLANVSAPLAELRVTKSKLHLDTMLLGKYEFKPEQIVKIEKAVPIPVIVSGIRIHHTVPHYPERMLFLSPKKPEELLQSIASSGFTGTASPQKLEELHSRGFPCKLLPLLLVFVLWNILFLWEAPAFFKEPSFKHLISSGFIGAFSMIFLLTFAAKKIDGVAKVFLKPGRDIGEITPYINVLMLLTGATLVFFGILGMLALLGF